MRPLVIATRRSPLARWQADHVAARLKELTGRAVELLLIVTQGDKILDVPLARVGGKGLFVKEIEKALLDKRADLAVHSLKDVPVELEPGLMLGAVMEREDPRDALCSPRHRTLAALPKGAKVGTSSLRRQCQLLAMRPDLELVTVRGNVQTRLARAGADLDAVVLAQAGLLRLGLAQHATDVLAPEVSVPAIGQGALGLEIRADDAEMASLVARLEHPATRSAVTAERALLARLQGGCQVPIAGHAVVREGELELHGLVGRPDGTLILRERRKGPVAEAARIGTEAGEALLAQGAGAILDALAGTVVGAPH